MKFPTSVALVLVFLAVVGKAEAATFYSYSYSYSLTATQHYDTPICYGVPTPAETQDWLEGVPPSVEPPCRYSFSQYFKIAFENFFFLGN